MLRHVFKFVAAVAFTGVLIAQQPSAQPSTRPSTSPSQHTPAAVPTNPAQGVATPATPAKATSSTPGKTRIKTTLATGKRGRKVVEPQPEPTPAPPPPPPTPEQMPPSAPQVTYSNGLLSISSQNSTIGDILNSVKRAMGTTIEGGSGVTDRVAVRLGPGEPKDVLRQLFGGSRFDYIILGSMQRPGAIDRIVLTPRQGGGAPGAPGTAVAQQHQPNVPVGRGAAGPQEQADPDAEPESEVDEGDLAPERELNDQPQAEDEQPQQQQGQPGVAQPGQPGQPIGQPGMQPNPPQNTPATDQNGNPQNPNQQQNGPKSPEQLLRELQQMQKQQQPNENQQDQQPQDNQESPQ